MTGPEADKFISTIITNLLEELKEVSNAPNILPEQHSVISRADHQLKTILSRYLEACAAVDALLDERQAPPALGVEFK